MDFLTLIILIVAIFLGIYIQTVLGFAAALVAIPILLITLSIQEAVAFVSIIFVVFSIILIYNNWKDIDKKVVGKITIGVILGLLLGIYFLKYGNPVILKKLLGVFVILYVGYSFIQKKKIKLFKKMGIPFGFLGGIFSGLFATGGPLYVAFLHNKIERAKVLRATIIGTLGITNFLRLPILMYNGMVTTELLIYSLYVLPFFLLAIYLGQKTFHKINEKTFKNILLVVLVLVGISLILS